jgi:hypothetical protein
MKINFVIVVKLKVLANKTALPYRSPERISLENVPVEHFQRIKATPHKEHLAILHDVTLRTSSNL